LSRKRDRGRPRGADFFVDLILLPAAWKVQVQESTDVEKIRSSPCVVAPFGESLWNRVRLFIEKKTKGICRGWNVIPGICRHFEKKESRLENVAVTG
jgi:hypothetical protein